MEEFDRVMRVNWLGQVHGVKAALPAPRRAGGGGIIGVSSLEGVRAVPLHAPSWPARWHCAASTTRCGCTWLSRRHRSPSPPSGRRPSTRLFFEHARSKLDGHMPKPPPPVYSADVVATAIVRAATRPTREVPVGGSAVGFYLGQRLNPALTDALLSLRRVQRAALQADRPDNGVDTCTRRCPARAVSAAPCGSSECCSTARPRRCSGTSRGP